MYSRNGGGQFHKVTNAAKFSHAADTLYRVFISLHNAIRTRLFGKLWAINYSAWAKLLPRFWKSNEYKHRTVCSMSRTVINHELKKVFAYKFSGICCCCCCLKFLFYLTFICVLREHQMKPKHTIWRKRNNCSIPQWKSILFLLSLWYCVLARAQAVSN